MPSRSWGILGLANLHKLIKSSCKNWENFVELATSSVVGLTLSNSKSDSIKKALEPSKIRF